MKATLFISKKGMEIRLANNVSFFSEENESKEDFIARSKETVERDYVDSLELDVMDAKKMGKSGTKNLQKKRETAKGMEHQLIMEILVQRGKLQEAPAKGGNVYNDTLTDEDIPEEGSGQEIAETKVEESETKTNKEPRKLKKQKSDEDALAELEEAKKNKGKEITFMCNKTKKEETGIIKGVRLDKRNNFIQYRIDVEGLGQFGKGIDAEDIKIGDIPQKEEVAQEESAE